MKHADNNMQLVVIYKNCLSVHSSDKKCNKSNNNQIINQMHSDP